MSLWAATALIAVSLGAALGEVLLRGWDWYHGVTSPYTHNLPESIAIPNGYFNFDLQPNLSVVYDSASPRRISINRWGFRGGDYDPVKPAGVKRIFTFGGSSTFDPFVPDEQTFTYLLGEELSERIGTRVESVNAGRYGYTTWEILGLLYQRTGQLDNAIRAYGEVKELAQTNDDRGALAVAIGNLGNVYKTRGDLDRAEEMYKKALAINEALGRKEGMAINYGNLGIVYKIRGDLDRAEDMHKKALAIDEALGRKEGMAIGIGNLGNKQLHEQVADPSDPVRYRLAELGSHQRAEDHGNQHLPMQSAVPGCLRIVLHRIPIQGEENARGLGRRAEDRR